jgi:hypothetical protein
MMPTRTTRRHAGPPWIPAAILAVLAGCAVPCWAQDSTSRNSDGGNGLPGDALGSWGFGASQRSSYVVDMVPFRTSIGTTFGIAPIMKSGKTSTVRFTGLNGASCISAAARTGAAYPASSYTYWNVPTAGLNATENNTALTSTISRAGTATVFGAAFMDFDEVVVGTSNVFVNQLYGAQVAFDPMLPTRLYVTRVGAASNGSAASLDRSQFGLGSIDADGNLCFRADSFGSTGAATSLLVGDNYFRVKLPLRSQSVNVIDNSGASNSASLDWVLVRSTTSQTVPTAIPSNIAGRSVVLGADFAGALRYESAVNTTSATIAHRPGTLDDRGNVSFSAKQVFGPSAGTAAILSRSSAGTGKTDSISIFGVDANGAVTTARTITAPTSLSDACDSFPWPLGGGDFRNYESQVTFRGGSGPVAIGKDSSGQALVAAVLYNGSQTTTSNPFDAIAVARFDPTNPNSAVQWTIAAWVDSSAVTGKSLYGDFGQDGAPGTHDVGEGDGVINANDAPIGRLASLSETPLALAGPSLSAPMFDAAGNLYFVSAVQLRKSVSNQIVNVPTVALIRGIYNASTFCYQLEEVLEVGQVFAGANSGRNYQIQSLNLADSDSISTAAPWSGSMTQGTWNNVNTSTMAGFDPRNMGGLVLSARICYDTNGDGVFEDPTVFNGNANSVDEAYNVVLYVGNTTAAPFCGSADFNCDGDVGTDADIEAFFACIAGTCPQPPCMSSGDFNGDGDVGTDADIEAFFRVLAGGTC